MADRQAQNEVRRAPRKFDSVGLQFAGQTAERDEDEGGAPIWQMRLYWSYPDYELNVGELIEQRDKMQTTAEALADECRERYGRSPSLAFIVSSATAWADRGA